MTSSRIKHPRWLVGIGAVLALAATGTILASTAGGSPSTPAPTTSGPTATISLRDLVQTDDQPGTLGYGTSWTTFSQLGGTVTWLPALGDVIKPDHRLFSLDGEPVVLMNGSFPMYRTLSQGVSDGPDVQELNADLIADGYDPYHEITPGDDAFTAGTTDAVDRWEQAHGLTQDGQVVLGRMVFLPGPRRVDSLTAVIQQSLPGSSGGAPGSSGGAASTAVLTTTSDHKVATVQLDASRQTEAVVGERVYVTLPSNQVVGGVITDVGRVAQTNSSSASSGGSSNTSSSSQANGGNSTSGAASAPAATIPVTIRLVHAGRLASLDQAPVTVAFALTTTQNALSIPVSALLATAGGGYAVDVVPSSGAVRRVQVTPGSFAGGYVQISGPGIAAGMQVRDTTGG